MEIASEFHNIEWEKVIDFALLDRNAESMTVINPQKYEYDGQITKDMALLKKQRGKSSMSVASVAPSSRGRRQMVSNRPTMSLTWAEEEEINRMQDRCYGTGTSLWAGYLPPGKQSILIFDRVNRQILKHDVVIELAPPGRLSGVPATLDFRFNPKPISAAIAEEIDNKYETEVAK